MESLSLCRMFATWWRAGRAAQQRDVLIAPAPEHGDSLQSNESLDIMQQALRAPGSIDGGMLHCWRHPNLRLIVTIGLAILNFAMFVEDPCSFAKTEAELAGVGDFVNFAFRVWPPELWLCVVKVILLFLGLLLGFLVGRFVLHHLLLRDMLKLPMFSELNGAVFTEIIGMAMFFQVAAWIWKQLLTTSFDDEYAQRYTPSPGLGITDESLAYWIQIFTAAGDVFTVVMLWDVMLQDTSQYSHWCLRLRILWTRSRFRLATTYITILAFFWIQVVCINQSYTWDIYFLETERSRGVLAALIFMLDVATVCQDWEFPFFDNPLEINLVGTNSPDIDFGCELCHCSGKWLNYGPMVMVMLLDLNNLKNQWRYGFLDAPTYYGEYLDADGWIWAVTNSTIAARLRECYSASPEIFHPKSSRGSCADAVPCNLTATEVIGVDPPCFDGDRQLTGRVTPHWLDQMDYMLPIIPVVLALLIFVVTAFCIPRMPAEQQRREAALSLVRAQRAAEGKAHGPNKRSQADAEQDASKPLTSGVLQSNEQAHGARVAPAVLQWPAAGEDQIQMHELSEFSLLQTPRQAT